MAQSILPWVSKAMAALVVSKKYIDITVLTGKRNGTDLQCNGQVYWTQFLDGRNRVNGK